MLEVGGRQDFSAALDLMAAKSACSAPRTLPLTAYTRWRGGAPAAFSGGKAPIDVPSATDDWSSLILEIRKGAVPGLVGIGGGVISGLI